MLLMSLLSKVIIKGIKSYYSNWLYSDFLGSGLPLYDYIHHVGEVFFLACNIVLLQSLTKYLNGWLAWLAGQHKLNK